MAKCPWRIGIMSTGLIVKGEDEGERGAICAISRTNTEANPGCSSVATAPRSAITNGRVYCDQRGAGKTVMPDDRRA